MTDLPGYARAQAEWEARTPDGDEPETDEAREKREADECYRADHERDRRLVERGDRDDRDDIEW